LLGTEFDGAHYWATGAFDFSICYIYEFDTDGTLLNTYPQPTGTWGTWGWRDLAWDGQYLYAGNDYDHPSMIAQIDPADGQPTGTYYGPYPVNPCRALAYDPVEDAFWTASFSSSLYKCFKDGSSQTYTNPGVTAYGAAAETASATNIWWWGQEGSGLEASEMLTDGTFTGDAFSGDFSFYGGGIAGGAGAYPVGSNWEFVGMAQGSPDHIVGYDLDVGPGDPLECDVDELSLYFGGTANFYLTAGVDNAGRYFGLFGTLSGTSPGTPLPGGLATLPINWDWFTDFMILVGLVGSPDPFFGNLDKDGNAQIELTIAGHLQHPDDFLSNWAYCLATPFDFASNAVEILLTGYTPPDEYAYDDGSTENLLGYYAGGEMCWMNWFEVVPGHDTLDTIGTIWGSATYPGYGPGNGVTGYCYIWEDVGGDGVPDDNSLLLTATPIVTDEYDNDVTVYYSVPTTTIPGSAFFIGVMLNSSAGMYIWPMDESSAPTPGYSWFGGTSGGTFDPVNLYANGDMIQMKSLGYDCYATCRAK
jgi:hypothetical protein